MKGKEITASFKKKFGKKILESNIDKNGKINYDVIWLKIPRELVPEAVKHLFEFGFPHFAVISANDFDDHIELIYEFSVGWGEREGEVLVNFKTDLPAKDKKIESICHLIPGALVSEREKQEMFGISIHGIPDDRNFFLPEDFKGLPGIKKDKDVDALEVD